MVLDASLATRPTQSPNEPGPEKQDHVSLLVLGSQQAALRGASLAFGKPQASPSVAINASGGINSALLAATKADGARKQLRSKGGLVSPSSDTRGSTIQHTAAPEDNVNRLSVVQPTSISWRNTSVPSEDPLSKIDRDTKAAVQLASPNIAANLASARYLQRKSAESLPDLNRRNMASTLESDQRDQLNGANRIVSVRYVNKAPAPAPTAAPESSLINEQRRDHPAAVETEHIAPTAALIGLFENNNGKAMTRESSEAITGSIRASSPLIHSPRPLRPLSSSDKHLATAMMGSPQTTAPRRKVSGVQISAAVSNEPGTATRSASKGPFKPTHPQPITADNERQHQNQAAPSLEAEKSRVRVPPPPPPPGRKIGALVRDNQPPAVIRRRSVGELQLRSSVPASNREPPPKGQARPPPTTQLPAQTTVPPRQAPTHLGDPLTTSFPLAPSHRGAMTPTTTGRGGSSKQFMTTDSLANAIVASSLASSRAASPFTTTPHPPLLPHRHSKPHLLPHPRPHHHHTHTQSKTRSHTPSPTRPPMRQTMRKPIPTSTNPHTSSSSFSSDEDQDIHHQRRRAARPGFLHKHPHKHHEGTRKRWRDRVTDRERRRYEGVWAANKGLLISLTPDIRTRNNNSNNNNSNGVSVENDVLNIIVRDIWSRSRLGSDVLEEIWDLVDRRGMGVLDREEFVVGMWLIDQRLKGRKLPVKVSLSVWESVRGLSGVRVPRGK
ncbi:MAG: Increased rDNA silencing protein [Watsoniomyces obsoletus]|nr:MAG: Increased rDNA silencing protein [Watsoniomyces obsoletus]